MKIVLIGIVVLWYLAKTGKRLFGEQTKTLNKVKAISITQLSKVNVGGEMAMPVINTVVSNTPLVVFKPILQLGEQIGQKSEDISKSIGLPYKGLAGPVTTHLLSDIERQLWTYLSGTGDFTDAAGRPYTGANRITLREYAKAMLGEPYNGNVIPDGWTPANGPPWPADKTFTTQELEMLDNSLTDLQRVS